MQFTLVAAVLSALSFTAQPANYAYAQSATAQPAAAVKDFTLPDAAGGNYSLAQRRGHAVVISFYKGFF